MTKVKLSDVIEGGLDLNTTKISKKAGGGYTGSIEGWQAAMQYAILQELKGVHAEIKALNETLGCYRVRRGMDALHSIDRRLAKRIPHRKRKAVKS